MKINLLSRHTVYGFLNFLPNGSHSDEEPLIQMFGIITESTRFFLFVNLQNGLVEMV
jgi:hypothetical protein